MDRDRDTDRDRDRETETETEPKAEVQNLKPQAFVQVCRAPGFNPGFPCRMLLPSTQNPEPNDGESRGS